MSIQLQDGLANQTVDHVLEDLLVRFLANVPNEDLSSIERVFFQVEEAQWFYTDFVKQLNPYLPNMKMKLFASKVLEKCPLIWKWGDPSDALARFGKYKSTIPVRGVALFNKDLTRLVLLKGTESNTWSFPRGKISKDESDMDCALREAEEETGFNASSLINEQDVVERTIKGKNYKIYLIKNVPDDFNFQPLVRNEIAKIEWHDIKTITKKIKSSPNGYFIVGTVLKPMLKWINKNKGVSNEDDSLYQTELKLKEYLGISPAPKQDLDAGRELLNILQKVSPGNENVNNARVSVPEHLQNQIHHYYQPPFLPPMLPGAPFHGQFHMPPPQQPPHQPNQPQPPQPPHQSQPVLSTNVPPHHPGYPTNYLTPTPPNQQLYSPPHFVSSPDRDPLNHQPTPQSFNKPLAFTNRKELLSILNSKKKSLTVEAKTIDEVSNIESNRSKAQSLLSVFNKKETPVAVSQNRTPASQNRTPAASQNILSLLNKNKIESSEESNFADDSESSQDFPDTSNASQNLASARAASASLLSILNKKPVAPQQHQQQFNNSPTQVHSPSLKLPHDFFNQNSNTHQASNELEASMRRASPAGFGLIGEPGKKLTLLKRSDDTQNKKESLEILSILTKPQQPKPRQPSTLAQGILDLLKPKEKIDRSAELLGLLKKKPEVSAPPAFIPASPQQVVHDQQLDDFEDFENFDDFHDFEEEDGLNDNFQDKFNFDIASDDDEHEYSEQTYNEPSPVQNYYEEPKKKVRLLKPGQLLNEIQPSQQFLQDFKQHPQPIQHSNQLSNPHGQNLLALLNGKKSPEPTDNLQSIYGSNGFRYTE